MIVPRESLTQEALKLPESERVKVIQDLLDSLCPESNDRLDDAWVAELDQRFAAWEADTSSAVTWTDLKSQK